MLTSEVLIVGGGPAGSSCARVLNRAGMDVVVLDKRTFPRDKTCAGWITPAVLEELDLDLDDYRRERTCQSITGFRVGRIGGGQVTVDYGRPVSYGIRRCEFDHYLLQRCNARLRLGISAKSIERTGAMWIVNGSFQAPMLVAAGGHFCPAARLLEESGGSRAAVVAAKEVEFLLDGQARDAGLVEGHVPEIYFCRDLAGYGWCFRKGNYVNVGLGREDRRRLSEHVADFCDWLKERKRIPADTPSGLSGHAYYLYRHSPRKLVEEGLLAVGDAAGLAYNESGEGIRPAIESGLIAARTIRDAAGKYDRDHLNGYATAIVDRFGRRNSRVGVANLVPSLVRQFLATRFFASSRFVRHTVLDRWFLHRRLSPVAGPFT